MFYSSLAALALMLGSGSARGEEPRQGVQMLARIPYLNRLFKNVWVTDECFERIGVDFDFKVDDIQPDPAKRQAKHERRQQLLAEKRELLIENARLQAQLEFAEERAELKAEIARLKADPRLAARPQTGRDAPGTLGPAPGAR
jgi:hypothetical protein